MNIFRRFFEPSSQAGLAILTQAAAGLAQLKGIAPEHVQTYSTALTGLFASLAILIPERGGTKAAPPAATVTPTVR